MRIRDCPAAVNGNDDRHGALGRIYGLGSGDLVGKATRKVANARKSEDLPRVRTSIVVVRC